MPEQQKREGHEKLLQEILESSTRKGQFTIETEEGHPDMVFEVSPADKPMRNRLRRQMPGGILDQIEMPDDPAEMRDMDVDEMVEEMDLSGVDMQDMTFTEEATEIWLDAIAQHFEHEYYSRSEIRSIFSSIQDDYFMAAGSYLMELGTDVEPVTGFRRGQ